MGFMIVLFLGEFYPGRSQAHCLDSQELVDKTNALRRKGCCFAIAGLEGAGWVAGAGH